MLGNEMPTGVLYISYDGILEPLGESQIVSYLEQLAADHAITLMSFEKPGDVADLGRVASMSDRLRSHQIDWISLNYHKRPAVLSTAFDVIIGILRARRICRQGNVGILHARSYVPALIALGARRVGNAAFLFDMRGFWVDEKVEAGHWKSGGMLYRAGKWWEKRFYRAADAVVSLTSVGAKAIPGLGVQVSPGVPIEVIPTCVDLTRFTPGSKDPELMSALRLTGSPVIGCVGTMGNWYMRPEMLDCLARFTRAWQQLQVLIVTRDDGLVLKRDAEAAGIPPDRLVIARARFDEMPRYIRLFDAGLFFIKPSFSKRASAATKLAEFLACGVPVIINDGVGDSGAIVRERRVGVVLTSPDSKAFEQALPGVQAMISDPSVRERCREVAREQFDLEAGVEGYRRLYRRLKKDRV
jgi:glycosyltransferase involved in cell wall biosynthesis